MLQISENVYLGADKRQFILFEKKANPKNSESQYSPLGYYPTVSGVIRALAERNLYTLVQELESLQKIQEDFIQQFDEFNEFTATLRKFLSSK